MKNICNFFDDANIWIQTTDNENYLTSEIYFGNGSIIFIPDGVDSMIDISFDEIYRISLCMHHVEGCDDCEKNEKSCER